MDGLASPFPVRRPRSTDANSPEPGVWDASVAALTFAGPRRLSRERTTTGCVCCGAAKEELWGIRGAAAARLWCKAQQSTRWRVVEAVAAQHRPVSNGPRVGVPFADGAHEHQIQIRIKA